MILAMVEIGGGYDVELADRAEEEAGGKDDGEISESKANYGCERNIGEGFGCRLAVVLIFGAIVF
jgi:hypothetical protein